MKPLFDELKFFLRENDLSNELIKKKMGKNFDFRQYG